MLSGSNWTVGGALPSLALLLGAITQVSAQQRQEIRWGDRSDKAYVESKAVKPDPSATLFLLKESVGGLSRGSVFAPSAGSPTEIFTGGLSMAVKGQTVPVPSDAFSHSPVEDKGGVQVFMVTTMGKVYKSPTPQQNEMPIGMVQPGQRYVLVNGGSGSSQGQQAQQAQQAQQGQSTGQQQGQQTGQQSSPLGNNNTNGQQQQQDPISQLLNKLLNGNQQNQTGSQTPTASTNNLTPAEQAQLNQAMAQADQAKLDSTGGADKPFGNEIYDTSGNVVGWDRDGDGQADLEDTNRDGVPDSYNGGTYKDAYLDPSLSTPQDEAAAANDPAADPAQGGSANGLNALGGSGSGKSEEEQQKDEEQGRSTREDGQPVDDEDGKSAKKSLITMRGRVVLIPRQQDGAIESAAQVVQSGWGDEWAESARSAPVVKTPAKVGLSEQLTKVESAIASWRLLESQRAAAAQTGQPVQAAASRGRGTKSVVDPNQYYVWLVSEDSWREGQTPVRLKVTLPEDELVELDDGAWVIVQGKMAVLRADARLTAEVEGEVKAFDLRRVILSSPEPPAISGGPQASEAIGAMNMGPPAFAPAPPSFSDELPTEELRRLAEQLEGGQG